MCKFGCHRKVTGPEKFVVKLFPPLWWSHYVLMGQNMASTIQKMKCLKAARVNVAFFCLNSEPASYELAMEHSFRLLVLKKLNKFNVFSFIASHIGCMLPAKKMGPSVDN